MILSVFTLVGVISVSIVLFGFWIVSSIVKLILRVTLRTNTHQQTGPGNSCINPGCRIKNPEHARFCRRCGSDLQQLIVKQNRWQSPPRYNPVNGDKRHAASV